MKILISGSTRFEKKKSKNGYEEVFHKACKDIGNALAKSGHTIIVGSDKKYTADLYVVEGYCETKTKNKLNILVYRPESDETPYAEIRDKYKNVHFEYLRSEGSWAVSRVRQILVSDCVILIGGGKGTLQAGHIAPVLERPVLSISSFGGSAQIIWKQIKNDYKKINNLDKKAQILNEKWKASCAPLVIELAEVLNRNNPFEKTKIKPLFIFSLFLAISLVLWVYLFLNPVISKSLTFFMLLGISSFLGTGLRNILIFRESNQNFLSSKRLFMDLTAGLLAAFGLALIYMAGGLSITGKFDFLTLCSDNDFYRVSLSMSVLGFAGSFLIEQSTLKLKNWFVKAITNEKKLQH